MQKYGLIGYPLKHSFSIGYFNEIFMAENIDAEYVNFEIPRHRRRQNGAGTGSGSRCYTGAYLSGVSRSMRKAAMPGSVAAVNRLLNTDFRTTEKFRP